LQPLLPQKIGSDVMSEMQATLGNRKLSLRLEIAPDLGPFNADSIRLRQALMELIQNAIRNTPDGGEVILRLGRDQGQEFLCFEVADTGQGIPVEEQGLIFSRLHVIGDINNHTSGATTYKGSGLGIGLSLVKAVVEAHGGKIELSSQAGVGTTVRLSIPANLSPSTVTGPALRPGNA
jgi:signal transduction histidine kinase